MRNGFVIFVVIVGLGLAATIGTLASQVFQRLDGYAHAPRDNVHWSILQVKSELDELRLKIDALSDASAESVADFRMRFDIFYSRVALLESAPIFAALRRELFFRDGIKNLRRVLNALDPMLSGDNPTLFANREKVRIILRDSSDEIRAFVLASVAHFSRISDEELKKLVELLYAVGLLIAFLLVILFASVLSLRWHSLVLQRQSNDLRESEEHLAATVASALGGVIIADAQGKILEFNDQASQCFGYPRARAIGRNLSELIIPPRMREMHKAGMKRYVETGHAKIVGQRIEIDALHANGHEFPVELAVGAAKSGGERIFVAYIRDISERRTNEQNLREARERAEAADEAKSRFLAVMSHEMRTPLNGITGILQVLRDTPLKDDQLALIDTADRSGELLLDLINDVLDISKMEAGKLHLNTIDFSPHNMIQRMTEILNVEAAKRSNLINLQVDEHIPALLHGDEKRLSQILLNLMANGNKFTSAGQIDVSMRMKCLATQNVTLEFAVADTGIGIPEDRMTELFTEFSSLENNYNRRQGGTGLGLSICKNLLELMGSTMHVDSKLGVGSRFWFAITLPISVSKEAHAAEDAANDVKPLAGTRILLAEDNPTNALVAKTILVNAGFDVIHAPDGEQAFAAASASQFDVILMDISMPGTDGIEATRLIRKLPAPASEVPIVAMTAHALPGDRERFLAAGMDNCITKPIRKSILLNAVFDSMAKRPSDVRGAEQPGALVSAEPAVLDEAELAQFARDVGDDVVPQVMAQFALDLQSRALAVFDGAIARDHVATMAAAHAIKGSAATLGAAKLSICAAQIEKSCAQQNWPEIDLAIERFKPIQAETVKCVSAYAARAS